jgi:hypothetical protein
MAITLRNGELTLRVETAGEIYRGSRFDWNGLVSSAKFRGVELLGQEKPMFQRNPRLFGRGLHNEFGINRCIGYDECGVGEVFPKIGTGWLRRDANPYFFYTQYVIEPMEFEFDAPDGERAVFRCDSGIRNGYGYSYTKEISLEGPSFSIRYSLANTGEKALETDEYVHNFLCFGGRRMDSGYGLEFPWTLNKSRFSEINDPEGVLLVDGKRVDVMKKTANQFYLGAVSNGITAADGLAAQWTLNNAPLGVSLSERGSFTPTNVAVWGWKSVISPELFHSFRVLPGETISWERVYTAGCLES